MPTSTQLAESTAQTTSDALQTQAGWLGGWLGDGLVSRAIKIAGALVVVIVLIIISRVIAGLVKSRLQRNSTLEDQEHTKKVSNLIGDMVFYCGALFSVFIGFDLLGFEVGLILGGVSFGVGLAFKEILGNMIAGAMILTTKEIKIGDVIEIHDKPKVFGKIEEIAMRYTLIRTVDLRQVMISNISLISLPIKTYSTESVVKMTVRVGVSYDSDIAMVEQVMLTAVKTISFLAYPDKTAVYLAQFGSSSIDFDVHYYLDPLATYQAGLIPDYSKGIVYQVIYEYFKANHITIAYPHLTIGIDPHDAYLRKFLPTS